MGYAIQVGPCNVGLGLFATRHFEAGERILVFKGKRFDANDPIHETPDGSNLLQTGRRTYIMPLPPGLYVNHSCNPNAGVVHGRHLVALRSIAAGQEIRFDYATTIFDDTWKMACACGEPNCRNLIEDFSTLPEELKVFYLHHNLVAPYLKRIMQHQRSHSVT